MKDLETVLKAIVADSRSKCYECSYYDYDYDDCSKKLVNDLLVNVEKLKKENDKLKEENKELMIRLFRSEQSM